MQLEDSFCVLCLQVLFTNLLPLITMCSSYTDLIDLTEEPSDPELNLDDDSIVFDDAPLPAVSQLQPQGMAMMSSRAPSKIMQHGLGRTCGHIKA